MSSSNIYVFRSALAVAALSISTVTYAAEDDNHVAAMRYVSLDVNADSANSRQYSGTGSFTLGKYSWLQGTLGKLTDDSSNGLGDVNTVGIGTGVKGKQMQFSLNFNNNKGDADYKQRDLVAAWDWYAKRFSVGLDASYRRTDDSLDDVFTVNRPLLGPVTVNVHADEQLKGTGFGAHANFNLTDHLSLSLGGMGYHYRNHYDITSTTSSTILDQLKAPLQTLINDRIQAGLQNLVASPATRSLALLDSSYNLGLSYQFDSVALSTKYLRDKALNTGDITHSVSLGATVFAGDHWMFSPIIGHSSSDQVEDVTFGGVSVSYNWYCFCRSGFSPTRR
jgi:hypothetical protein